MRGWRWYLSKCSWRSWQEFNCTPREMPWKEATVEEARSTLSLGICWPKMVLNQIEIRSRSFWRCLTLLRISSKTAWHDHISCQVSSQPFGLDWTVETSPRQRCGMALRSRTWERVNSSKVVDHMQGNLSSDILTTQRKSPYNAMPLNLGLVSHSCRKASL